MEINTYSIDEEIVIESFDDFICNSDIILEEYLSIQEENEIDIYNTFIPRNETSKPLKTFKCKICNITFNTKRKFQVHNSKNHLEPLICPYCGIIFNRDLLSKHLANHTKQPPKKEPNKNVCSVCDKIFSTRDGLNKHFRIHSGEARYKCDFCDMKFIHLNSKTSHVRTKHTKAKDYECEECGKKFAVNSARLSHIKRIHTKDYNHECEKCLKKFPTKNLRDMHFIEKHTNIKNVKCKVCDKSFGTKKQLYSHARKKFH